MSIFETAMLVCFGAAWPFSVYKSYKSRRNEGKSVIFLWIIFIGYIAGTIHKLLYSIDLVICLYVLNGFMVMLDIILYYRNKHIGGV